MFGDIISTTPTHGGCLIMKMRILSIMLILALALTGCAAATGHR